MERMNAEVVANVIGEKVLQSLEEQEQQLDQTIKRLEEADDDELERLRERRMQQMKQNAFKAQELRAKGHGEYATITDTKEFFEVMKQSDKTVVHFFTPANAFCELVDGHLERLSKHHIETRFIRLNAEKSEYLVDKLGVWMIPCIALIKDQKVVKMIQGLDELGGTDKFTTAFLAYFIGLHNVLKYEGADPESPLDSCGGAYMNGNQPASSAEQLQQARLNSIRQSIYYDSDLEEEDDD
uniref:Thioredoxin domain-containing protein n=1 Tax=Globisporangium ultimum (strain ATCC 200006 / CBS 805.95 / DAOM BR144) TaxID=431595 RepID=K3X3H2_GLOUD